MFQGWARVFSNDSINVLVCYVPALEGSEVYQVVEGFKEVVCIYVNVTASPPGSLATVNLRRTFRLGIWTCDRYQCNLMEMASTFGGIRCCDSSTCCK